MKGKWKRVQAWLLAAVMLMTQAGTAGVVHADAVAYDKVVTLGADLDESQKADILQFFGIAEDEVKIITITNQDERDMLGLLLPMEQIGTHTYSCAMVSPTTRGGIQVKTANMNYVTSNMIAATLSTSGVVNCDVLTAAPFMVSGTGALTGTMMAYETASGEELDQSKKELANEELVTTEELADEVGQEEATLVVNDIKIHIIRDQVKEEDGVRAVVDNVVDTVSEAMNEREAAGGETAGSISDTQKESLYTFGYKVSQQDYNYDDMKVTLQRVTENVTAASDLEDPITETFEDLTEESQLAEDSILRETDDEALGDESNVNTTAKDVVEVEAAGTESVKLTQTAVIEGGSLVSDRNVILAGGHLYNLSGEQISDGVYDDVDALSGGYLYFSRNGLVGAASGDGAELIPAAYDAFGKGSRFWQIALKLTEATEDDYDFTDYRAYYQLITADLYFVDNGTAEKLATLTRDELKDWRCMNRYIAVEDRAGAMTLYDEQFNVAESDLSSLYSSNVPGTANIGYDISSSNGQAVLLNPDGSTALTTGYRSISDVYPDAVEVSDGEHTGLLDYDGSTVIPVTYARIFDNYYAPYQETEENIFSARGYYAVEDDDGQICFAVRGGAVTAETGRSYSDADLFGASVVYQDADERYHIVAADGVDTALPAEYTRCYALAHSDGMLYRCTDEEYNYYLVDWHGELLWAGSDSVEMSGDGTTLTFENYSAVSVFSVELPEAPELEAVDDGRVSAALETVEAASRVSGVSLTKVAEIENASPISNTNVIKVGDPESEDRMCALADPEGNVLTDYFFDDYAYLNGYYGQVQIRKYGESTYSVLTESGQLLSEQPYDYLDILNKSWTVGYYLEQTENEDEADFKNYSDGTDLTITQADIYFINDGIGSLVASLDHEQISRVHVFDLERIGVADRAGKWAAYDGSFTALVTDQNSYSDADELSGMQEFRENGQTGLMNADGEIILAPMYQYVDSYTYDGKYMSVDDGEHYGLIDLEGHLVLPTVFDDIIRTTDAVILNGKYSGFDNLGYFAVEKDGAFGYAAVGGEMTCETEYTVDQLKIGGAAAMLQESDTAWRLIAADGSETVLNCESPRFLEGSHGMFLSGTDGDLKLYDWHGEEILSGYTSYKMSENGEYLFASQNRDLEVYRVTYEGMDEELPVSEKEEVTEEAQADDAVVEETAEEAVPAEENAVAEEETDESEDPSETAKSILASVEELLSGDYEANAAAAAELAGEAAAQAEAAGLTDAAVILNSAVTLLESGSGDADSVMTLLQTAESLL